MKSFILLSLVFAVRLSGAVSGSVVTTDGAPLANIKVEAFRPPLLTALLQPQSEALATTPQAGAAQDPLHGTRDDSQPEFAVEMGGSMPRDGFALVGGGPRGVIRFSGTSGRGRRSSLSRAGATPGWGPNAPGAGCRIRRPGRRFTPDLTEPSGESGPERDQAAGGGDF